MKKIFTKKNMLTLLKAVAFLLVLSLLLQITSLIFMPKENKPEDGMNNYITRGYRGEPKNSLDMILVGNSDLYRGFSPIVMWNDYGYTSYVCGLPAKRMWNSYWVLKDSLKTQKPKAVVLEVDCAYNTKNPKYIPQSEINKIGAVKTLDSVQKNGPKKPLINKNKFPFKQIFRLYYSFKKGIDKFPGSAYDDGLGTVIGFEYPIIKNHSRWQSLKEEDFTKFYDSWHYDAKGFVITADRKPYEGGFSYMKPDGSEDSLDPRTTYYMNKIIKLCNSKNIKVMLVEMPAASSWNSKKHNRIERFAKENDLNFIDLNEKNIADACGFNWLTDTKDKGTHLNMYGAEKVTHYLGRFIHDNYSLTDHRGDPRYSQWTKDSAEYQQKKQAAVKQLLAPVNKQNKSS